MMYHAQNSLSVTSNVSPVSIIFERGQKGGFRVLACADTGTRTDLVVRQYCMTFGEEYNLYTTSSMVK
jgi:hypothetical protein